MPAKPPLQKLRSDQYQTPDISEGQYLLIGKVIAEWSKFEAAMEDTIWMLLGLSEEDGRSITNRLGADGKIQLLRVLAPRHIANPALLAKITETLKYADEIKDARNFIAHGVWGTLMPEGIPIALSLKPKADPGEVISEGFEKERMESILDMIRTLKQRLIDLPELIGKPRRVPSAPQQP